VVGFPRRSSRRCGLPSFLSTAEARNTLSSGAPAIRISSFGLLWDFGFRISDFNAVLRPFCVGLLALLLSAAPSSAQNSNAPVRFDYSSFRLISEKNIFNANRFGRSAAPPPSSEERKSTRVEAFTLVGTMSYGKGPFAFFDGTSSDFRKVLHPGGTIAGCKLTEISGTRVKLEADTNHFELRVGNQLRREDDGPWQFLDQGELLANSGSRSDFGRREGRDDSRRGDWRGSDSRRGDSRGNESRGASSAAGSRSSSPPTPSPAVTLTSEQENEILKRLMQQREQETK
jgi:hypothetical protein